MTKLAVDVVLLPSEEMMEKSIEVNKQLLKTFDKKIILNRKSCLPHISLAMGCIDENAIPNVGEILREIAGQFPVMELIAFDIHVAKIPTGKKVSVFQIEKTKQLQSFHETSVKKLAPYFSYDVSTDMLYNPPEVEELTLCLIKNYPEKSSFEKFSPHITIGLGEVSTINFPITFTTSKLALCHLGNYCTCRRVLTLSELGSET